jgi:2-phospho-L-lactate guanylyltransferase
MRLDDPVIDAESWTVVIPVKVLSTAKTRMSTAGHATDELAFAFFQDTLEAALASAPVQEVIVATADERVRAAAEAAGCTVVSDADHPGINAAVRWASASHRSNRGLAIVVSDLPTLTPASLASVLFAARSHATSFLADADGSGTTMWFATRGAAVDPHFGAGSRAAHRSAGDADLVALMGTPPDLWAAARRDVDTEPALAAARMLGLGAHTQSALSADGGGTRIVTVIHRHEQAVAVVDEDGLTTTIPEPLVAAAGLREVHPGQRLVVELAADGSSIVRLP